MYKYFKTESDNESMINTEPKGNKMAAEINYKGQRRMKNVNNLETKAVYCTPSLLWMMVRKVSFPHRSSFISYKNDRRDLKRSRRINRRRV